MLDPAHSPPIRFCRWPRLAWMDRQVPRRLEEAPPVADASDRSRRARAQPARRRSRPAARRLVVFTGLSGLGQVQPRVRHDLRRGPAPLRRVAVGVRPAVPRPDGQARRRLHRGPVARRSRSTRSRPTATRARPSARSPRSTTTCGCSSPASASRTARSAASGSAADPAADRRPGAGDGGGHPVPGARAGRPRPQGRVRRPVRRAAGQGLLARARSTAWCTRSPSRRS